MLPCLLCLFVVSAVLVASGQRLCLWCVVCVRFGFGLLLLFVCFVFVCLFCGCRCLCSLDVVVVVVVVFVFSVCGGWMSVSGRCVNRLFCV